MVIKEAHKTGCEILKNADIESFLADSLILLCHTLSITKEKYIIEADREISEADYKKYISLIEKRANKCPVKYLTGICEFMGIDFIVEPGVLIPRPDTEILVEKALSLFSGKDSIVIGDFCCGSGCIGLSLISFLKNATLYSFDISDTALKVTEKNAKHLNLTERTEIIKKDILNENTDILFDIIVSNPPYIPTDEYKNLMEDVRLYEPEEALHAEGDDLKFYRHIISSYAKNLKEKGYLLFEVGYNQSERVMKLFEENGNFSAPCTVKDYSGINRVVMAQKTGPSH